MEENIEKSTIEDVKGSVSPPSFFAGWALEIWEFARVIIISLLIVLPIRFFIAQPFVVKGASMEPNFYTGQYLIIDEASYYFRSPERGEVIVFRYPQDPAEFFIKRIIGLPGERVEVTGGKVRIVNKKYPEGMILNESYLPSGRETLPDIALDLGPTQYFVLGDNRLESSDSRRWGPLDRSFFIGRALVRLWPPTTAQFLEGATY